MTRTEALDQIDTIRGGLYGNEADYNNSALTAIIGRLWDGYPVSDVQALAAGLQLRDYTAQQQIRQLVAGITE